ncbi:MAG: 4Fe-4S dicluster domain-containing protein [Nannocystaceae bacterium]|nr:4Fe-4S dicluster domain-containing protein [Nannocystaceae bacterium]
MSTEKYYGSTYWRSLAQRELSYDEAADGWREFEPVSSPATRKPGAMPVVGAKPQHDENPEEITLDEMVPTDGVSRRRFFSVVGASAALAGVTGCVRKPKETILEFSERPEDLVPGKPMFYASAIQLGASVEGVVVESQDGRPTKIEGNPKHSGSQGATSVWTQASVLDLYDPERTRVALDRSGGEEKPVDMATARAALGKLLQAAQANGGAGLGLLLRWPSSPTQRSELRLMTERLPKARVFVSDALAPSNAFAAAEAVGGPGARAFHHLEKTSIVFAADSDFLGVESDTVRMAREWAKTRRVVGPTDFMSRLYVVEPSLSGTGVMADHRLRLKGSQVGEVLLALVHALSKSPEFKLPADVSIAGLPAPKLDKPVQDFVDLLAKDLGSPENRSKSAILVGARQPAWVHVLGLLIDVGLGNQSVHGVGAAPEAGPPPGTGSLRWRIDGAAPKTEDLAALAAGLGDGSIKTLLCFETNPAYEGPGDLGLAKLLAKATVVHMGQYRDETAQLAAWHIPTSHWLEAWGDVEAIDGTTSIQQPLIEPLHDTYSVTELLGFVATGKMLDGYSLLKSFWTAEAGPQFSDRIWRQWVHDGVVSGIPREPGTPKLTGWTDALAPVANRPAPIAGLELDVHVDPKVLDGRFSGNGWLQELPHPISKLTWDNAAYLSNATATKLGVGNQQRISLTVEGRTIEAAVWIQPGQADDTVSLSLGYGRKATIVSTDAGFDVNPLRSSKAPWFAAATLAAGNGNYTFASTQDYGSLKPPSYMGLDFPERPIVLEHTRAEFKADPNFVEKANLMERTRLQHLWDPPKLTGKQQWGMSIDLNTCTGCNACVIACQAENNIPVVGKAMVLRAREMHWMRIDRYFRGDEDNPTAVVQPMACQHCEAAPCETVCPVAATTHSPEGLNDMAYNRCIGTRYCSNNCPYKVRRFNYLAFNLNVRPGAMWTNDPDGAWLAQLQKNPDVTVRFRGVMEKCTYCVQRINEAKIDAHVAGRDLVEDGRILTACQQVCPTEAVVFGDIRDPDSKVSKAKRSPRDYTVLRDLNNHPRTTYLARIRNPHPDTTPKPAPAAKGAGHEGGHGT